MRRIGRERPRRQSIVLPSSVYTVLVFVPTNWRVVIVKTVISAAISAYLRPESWAKFFIDMNIGLLQAPIGEQLGCLPSDSTNVTISACTKLVMNSSAVLLPINRGLIDQFVTDNRHILHFRPAIRASFVDETDTANRQPLGVVLDFDGGNCAVAQQLPEQGESQWDRNSRPH